MSSRVALLFQSIAGKAAASLQPDGQEVAKCGGSHRQQREQERPARDSREINLGLGKSAHV